MPTAPRTIVFVLIVSILAVPPAIGQTTPRGNSSIQGTVTAAGRPLVGALIVRNGLRPDTARSDSLGHYVLQGLAQGRHVFAVSHAGYETVEMEVTFTSDQAAAADIPMEPAQAGSGGGGGTLDEVGFVERRRHAEQSHERATFLGPAEIAAHSGAVKVSQLFEGVSDVSVRYQGGISILYGYDRRCVMNVWVDGSQVTNAFPPVGTTAPTAGPYRRPSTSSGPDHYTGLDDIVPLSQVAAVEVYPRPLQIPQRFRGPAEQIASTGHSEETRTTDCGAILIWSRR